MKANYGYMDGSGEFYITIDTDLCIECADHGCLEGCPKGMFAIITDDYDDEVAEIKGEFRKKIKYDCADCKPVADRPPLPCVEACTAGAIVHSW
ncbi:ferredoxin [candidate division LCP-89 bacterium B3_LCP]|uniref:Ferredoxin n=1 Tax=candidate division LCP-89 bacterium B3_LCP TaxID=2012998 RepID=A0A532UYK3_UNCL8|nr:MAG: ferredoxin [candidate division LCP-89 bacterium B3_LCP]